MAKSIHVFTVLTLINCLLILSPGSANYDSKPDNFNSLSDTTEELDEDELQSMVHEKAKYYRPDEWSDYLVWIKTAENNPNKCETQSSLGCFKSQIDNDLVYWMDKGITLQDIETSKPYGVHYQIINHQLYRQYDCMFPTRCEGIEHFLLNLIHKLPDLEMVINVRDWPVTVKGDSRMPIMSFSRDDSYNNDILYPAWSFWSGGPAIDQYPTGIGRFDLLTRSIVASSPPWNQKTEVCFFRGSRTSADRDWLILLSRRQPDLVDAQYTKNQAWRSIKDTLGYQPAPTISFEYHCKYKYLINFRGVAASFRYKHLFLCQSLVFNMQSSWIEFFYPSLVPWYHYVPVNESNFISILTFFKENDSLAASIASNGFQFIKKHLTLEAVELYWEHLLMKYSQALKYKPKLIKSYKKIVPKRKP
ncbi:protein O-glucosyltransferase 1 [Tetranychus urticae]|uniref:Glycosyl transferase CAP10 domain-containing protein n=1 Tax=Tetranychus urticae TaxID=32264 RepID=T1JZ24_TETUR|nr:protein O-glucosyltransferase 1 [Tetranychus urticae]XP_025015983.1 protein O-glucosyltransferase 1 [Tetranychus urticae]